MKASSRSRYGPPEVINITTVEKPTIGDNDLLIKVFATTVNRTDCAILIGKPFIMRFFTGLFKPARTVTGTDFAGIIEAVGKSVSKFKSGDRLWGFDDTGLGSDAQYICILEKSP